MYVSTDDGAHWIPVNEGLPGPGVTSLAIHDNTLYAGTGHSGVWRRSLVEMVTGVQAAPAPVPASIVLMQNYPNPFNPSTTIKYELPRASHVTLTVYDVLGREVATLVNGVEEPGYKSVRWDATGVASGVYFYRLTAGDFVQTKKLLLLH